MLGMISISDNIGYLLPFGSTLHRWWSSAGSSACTSLKLYYCLLCTCFVTCLDLVYLQLEIFIIAEFQYCSLIHCQCWLKVSVQTLLPQHFLVLSVQVPYIWKKRRILLDFMLWVLVHYLEDPHLLNVAFLIGKRVLLVIWFCN